MPGQRQVVGVVLLLGVRPGWSSRWFRYPLLVVLAFGAGSALVLCAFGLVLVGGGGFAVRFFCGFFSAVVSFVFGLVPGWGRLSPNPFFFYFVCLIL